LEKKCEICGGSSQFLFKGRNSPKRDINFFECESCGIIFQNPLPPKEILKEYYPQSEYYSLMKIDKVSKKVKFRRIMYRTYFSQESNILKRIFFLPLKFLIRGIKIKPGLNLLDIGCGSGQFIYDLRPFGMNLQGVEPNNFNKVNAKREGLNIKNCELEEAKYPKEHFDLITMSHVLEHLLFPKKTLDEVNRILRKRGLFILAIPNSNSLAFRIFKNNWLGLFDIGHLFNYSDKNIKILLEKSKFRIKKIRYVSRPDQFVISVYILLGLKKRSGPLFRILECLFLPLTWGVNLLKWGDQIEIWCEKDVI